MIKDKKAEILAGNLVFIILNLVFLAVLIIFISQQGSGAIILEETYAKEIALMIDSSIPGTELILDMESAKEHAEENGINFKDIVKIENNIVIVKISKDSGYQYSFFNNVILDDPYPIDETKYRFKVVAYK